MILKTIYGSISMLKFKPSTPLKLKSNLDYYQHQLVVKLINQKF